MQILWRVAIQLLLCQLLNDRSWLRSYSYIRIHSTATSSCDKLTWRMRDSCTPAACHTTPFPFSSTFPSLQPLHSSKDLIGFAQFAELVVNGQSGRAAFAPFAPDWLPHWCQIDAALCWASLDCTPFCVAWLAYLCFCIQHVDTKILGTWPNGHVEIRLQRHGLRPDVSSLLLFAQSKRNIRLIILHIDCILVFIVHYFLFAFSLSLADE